MDFLTISTILIISEKLNVFYFVETLEMFPKGWFSYNRQESQGIAASRNRSDQVYLRLSAIIRKPVKNLLAIAVVSSRRDRTFSISAAHCDSLRSIAINGNHSSQLLQLLAITTLLFRGTISFP